MTARELPAEVRSQLRALLARPFEEALYELERDRRLHSIGVWAWLMDRCQEVGPYQPPSVLPAARLALAVARLIPQSTVPDPREVADGQALAGAALAEALLRTRDSHRAEQAMAEAEQAMVLGSHDPRVEGPAVMVRGLLLRSRGQPTLAAESFGRAAHLFRLAGEPTLEGVALLRQGLVLARLGETRRAKKALENGLRLVQDARYQTLFRNGAEAFARIVAGENR